MTRKYLNRRPETNLQYHKEEAQNPNHRCSSQDALTHMLKKIVHTHVELYS